MCERSFSDGSRGVGLGVPPHIRDALEQARVAAREAETPTRQSEFSRENTGEGIHSLARTAIRRESSFVQRLLNKEKQLMNIRTYVNDSLRSHKMHHAYLRNSFLDPAIGLEFKLLEHCGRLNPALSRGVVVCRRFGPYAQRCGGRKFPDEASRVRRARITRQVQARRWLRRRGPYGNPSRLATYSLPSLRSAL